MVDAISFTSCGAVTCVSGPCCIPPVAIQIHSISIGYVGSECASIQSTSVRVTPQDAPISSVVINGITSLALTDAGIVVVGGVTYREWLVNLTGPPSITACGGQTLTYVMTGCDGVPWTESPFDICLRCTTICVGSRQTFSGLFPTGKFLQAITSLTFSAPTTAWAVSVQDIFGTRQVIGSYCGPAKSSWNAAELDALQMAIPNSGILPYHCPNLIPATGNCDLYVYSAGLNATAITVTHT